MITTCLSNMEKKCAYNKMPLTKVAFSGLGFSLLPFCAIVTHLSSDYGDYLLFVMFLLHTRWLSLNDISHLVLPLH